MRILLVIVFISSFAYAEQVVDYLNCGRLVTLNVSNSSVSFTLECENEADVEDKLRVTGNINDGVLSYHLGQYLGLKTLRVDTEIIKTLMRVAE